MRGNQYFWETEDVSAIQQTMAINALAPMFITREFLPGMIELDTDCRIVNIASSAGLVANPRMAVYAASKWAAVGWSDSVRLELEQAEHTHIKITTVCPTYINTGMFDGAKGIFLTPMLEQEEVVDGTWKEMLKGGPFLIIPWTSRLNKILTGIPAGQRARLLPRPRRGVSLDGRILRPRRTCEVVAGSPRQEMRGSSHSRTSAKTSACSGSLCGSWYIPSYSMG